MLKEKKTEKIKKSAKLTKKAVSQKKEIESALKSKKYGAPKYFQTIGRRKTSVARVRLYTQGEKVFLINDKPIHEYFPTSYLQEIVVSPLEKMNIIGQLGVSVKVKGGGLNSQAEAIRHGIARALVLFNIDFRKKLKNLDFLKRDPRMKERKKFGLKGARRAPQWSKR